MERKLIMPHPKLYIVMTLLVEGCYVIYHSLVGTLGLHDHRARQMLYGILFIPFPSFNICN